MNIIKYNSIYKYLRDNLDNEVTEDGVIFLQQYLENSLIDIVKQIKVDFNRYNLERQQYGLRVKGRIPESIFKKAVENFNTVNGDVVSGEVGDVINSNTTLRKWSSSYV